MPHTEIQSRKVISSYGGVGGGGGSVQIGGGTPAGAGEVRQSQGYTTTAPGAFVPRKTPYGKANNGGGGDVYASGDGAAPARSSAAQDALRRLGKEPGLDDKGRTAAPEAPSAVQVNQATSQDLSLPDDEMQMRGRKSSSQGNKIFNRTIGRMGNRMLNQIVRVDQDRRFKRPPRFAWESSHSQATAAFNNSHFKVGALLRHFLESH